MRARASIVDIRLEGGCRFRPIVVGQRAGAAHFAESGGRVCVLDRSGGVDPALRQDDRVLIHLAQSVCFAPASRHFALPSGGGWGSIGG